MTYHADGSALVDAKGATTYELFVTDTPPGPDELLSIGHLVLDITPEGDYHVLSQTGFLVSFCEELS